MPDFVVSLLASVAVTAVGVGIAWGVLAERVANLKEEVKLKASLESVGHLDKRLDEIKEMLAELLHRRGGGE
jgi:hypothetical protein